MRLDKMTLKAQEALQEADSLVNNKNHASLDAEHLLLALITQQDGVIPPLLDRLGVSKDGLARDLEEIIDAKPKMYGDSAQPHLSPEVGALLRKA